MKIIKTLIIYPIQFLFFLEIYYFFRFLSNKIASNLGAKIFKFFGPLTKSHDNVFNNLKRILKTDNKNIISIIATKSWENLGRTIAEFAHLSEITKVNNKYIKVKGDQYLKNIAKNKEQVIFIAIHQSNWEVLAPTIGNFGIKLNSVYRHINNPLIDRFILNIRKKVYKSSKSILSPKGKQSAKDMMMSIKNGYSIALLIDQKDSSGQDVPLMGISAKTQTAFLKLSKKFNLKIYPIENKRFDNVHFEMTVHKPLIFFNKENQLDEISAMSNIHNLIGSWIKKNPENWLWQHKRWD